MAMARTILDRLTPGEHGEGGVLSPTIIRTQIKEQLTAMGYEVAGPVGQSDFKCSLAVKRSPEDEEYALAILIDDEGHYQNENLVEQYYQRPAILRDFGWTVLPVYAKDWLHQPQRVMEEIVRALGSTVRDATAAAGSSGRPAINTAGGVATNAGGGPGMATPVTPDSAVSHYDHLDFHRFIHPENKTFWEAATDGNKLIVRWGRRGARVRIRLRSFPDELSAQKELAGQEEEQKVKGFIPDQEPR
ncbi:MAG TPA: WGR domain-containing protein, partial [Puia sp.]|nr:WGR domain-containing protein [Puia sp.]